MGVKKYTQEVIKEGKRVRWPKKDQFIPAFVTALVICAFCALVLSLEDLAAGSLIGQLKQLFSGLKSSSTNSSEETTAAIRAFMFWR